MTSHRDSPAALGHPGDQGPSRAARERISNRTSQFTWTRSGSPRTR